MRPAIKTTDRTKKFSGKKANPIIEKRLIYVTRKLREGWDWEIIAMEIGVQKIQLYRYCYWRGLTRNEQR